MRLCVAVALISTLVSTSVFAAPKGKKKKAPVKAGPSMDTVGVDPVHNEKSDEGPYAPQSPDEDANAKSAAASRSKKVVPRLPPRAKLMIFGDAVYGFGRSPLPGPASQGETPDGRVLSVVVGATYDLSPKFTAGLRAPWSTASVDQPMVNQSQSSMAFGNPELFGEYRVRLGRPTELPILFGAAVPVAQGDPDPGTTNDISRRQAVVNLFADASRGWQDGELYAVKRIPLILGAGIRHHRNALELHASTKLVLGINTGGDLVPQLFPGGGRLVVNPLSLRDVTLVGATYSILENSKLWAGLDAWVVYNAIEPLEYESPAKDPTPFQFVAEPRVGMRLGKLRPALGVILPLGGRLAEGGMTGFRLHVAYAD